MQEALSAFARDLEFIYQQGNGASKMIHVDFSNIGTGTTLESIRLMQGTTQSCMQNLGKSDCLELIAVEKSTTGKYSWMMFEILRIPSTTVIKFVNAPTNCPQGDKNLAGITSGSWNDPTYANCGWKARSYTLNVTKVSIDEIDLVQVGA
jgi:hypothetical protein